jgi:fatty acid desaturase
MSATTEPQSEFSIGQARKIVADLFEPKPWIYWTDFLLSLIVGGACFRAVRFADNVAISTICFIVSCFLYYRVVLFTHEMTHLREGSFKAFRVVWNVLCGIPFLIPSYLYYIHLDHHKRKSYGTEEDGEYLALANGPRWKIVFYLAQSFVIPPLAWFRFLVLTPASWFCPPLRRWLHRHASSMIMDPGFVRPEPTDRERRIWRFQETGCFLVCAGAAWLIYRGRIPYPVAFLCQVYATGVFIVLLNEIRTIAAHGFTSDGGQMTFADQLVDSVNFPGRPLTGGLWAPVGLRYHALHHLFPSMPYHNLDKAHHRLMAELPADSPYRGTVSPGLWVTMSKLWSVSKQWEQDHRLSQAPETRPQGRHLPQPKRRARSRTADMSS